MERLMCRDCLRALRQARKTTPALRRSFDTQQPYSSHSSNASAVQKPTTSRPLRLGIIGSGPAAFYGAARVMQRLPDAKIDMYEQLPVPFGLVRYGVAPDHPEVKNCQDRFEEVASSPNFTFIGNATVGTELPLARMRDNYDALLFAYGASKDRLLGLPGEETLRGVHSARAFVGWYNGLPEFADLVPKLDGEQAVVIGNGNVALDVARVLLTDVDVLRKTDISEPALDALSRSKVKSVVIAGRRGPMQASFTIKEVRELVNLPDTRFTLHDPDLLPAPAYISQLPKLQQRRYRLATLLRSAPAASSPNAFRHVSLLPLALPTAFLGPSDSLTHIRFERAAYTDPTAPFAPSASIHPTGTTTDLPASVAFRSIGYKAEPLPGLTDLAIAFDTRKGILANDGRGRVLSPTPDPATVSGCYCAGWVKSGPNGVIASTMEDAFATAEALVADWERGAPFLHGPRDDDAQRRGVDGWEALRTCALVADPVSWDEWRSIDAAEKRRAQGAAGRPRNKFTSVGGMLDAARGLPAAA